MDNYEDILGVPDDEIKHEDDDDIITLTTSDGKEIDFVEIAGIAHKQKFYLILQPVELFEGMNDDEAMVFEYSDDENGNEKFDIVLDDEIINAVFKTYNELLDNATRKEEEE